MVLDRQVAFALGWLALAQLAAQPDQGRLMVIALIGVATLVHPSAGLQVAMVLSACLAAWCLLGRRSGVSCRSAFLSVAGLAIAVAPGLALNLAQGSKLMGEMPARDFWLLSVELQHPQHMLPHLWQMPQWLACASYLVLAVLAISSLRIDRSIALANDDGDAGAPFRWPAARVRLLTALGVIISGLGVAWYLIEKRQVVQVTVFQPFRMATVARGIALVFLAGRIVSLWKSGGPLARLRAVLLSVSVTGDWLMVVVTLAEAAVWAVEAVRSRLAKSPIWQALDAVVFLGMLGLGLNFLAHHDTKSGHLPLLAAIGIGVAAGLPGILGWRTGRKRTSWRWTGRRWRVILALAWAAPAAALLAAVVPSDGASGRSGLVRSLISRCRFVAVPADDVERLALWCREHTPVAAHFIGPPGPKTFRLWSQRSLAFNRASWPYHAAGLGDWVARFRDHVAFHGDIEAFVHDYLADRHGFEARYDQLTDADRAALALRQGATYVVARAPEPQPEGRAVIPESGSPLEFLHGEGCFAVYRVKTELLVQRQR